MTRLVNAVSTAALVSLLIACSGGGVTASVVKGEPGASGATPNPASPAAAARSAAKASASASAPAVPVRELHEEDFQESEHSRDPFRSFSEAFTMKNLRRGTQRQAVLLEQYPLEDLKLVGIVTGIEPPRAMLVDPSGQGHVVHRNDFIGRAEHVQTAGPGGADFEMNWRVDRIRAGDIVLVREDPSNPDVPTATRVLSLRPEEQK